MTKPLRLRAPVLAVAAAGLTLAGAGLAGAHPGNGPGGSGPGGARAATCEIAADKLVSMDGKALTRIGERLQKLVDADRISPERKATILARRQKQITVRMTRASARITPMLALLGMTSAELKAARKDRGLREIIEDKGVTRAELRAARREGRTDARTAVRGLCSSGAATTTA